MKDLDQAIKTTYLKDYQPADFSISDIKLTFELNEDKTQVRSVINLHKVNAQARDLILLGEGLKLGFIKLNGKILAESDYKVTKTSLTILNVVNTFTLEIETFIQPQNNFSLEGLYQSSGNYCTQCEAQGFRKITYYLDRPDVMALFTTTIIADKNKYPVLLSNGNPIDSGDLEGGRHWVTWQDPFKKPCYLFALVAGDLAYIEDFYTTSSGHKVQCRIYVQHHNIQQCDFAMSSLKKSMQWDEETFGREYDLAVYNIVAVDDFNMGAMENKGLNIFNSKYVLAQQETATDTDFIGIEAVIGHEYFHNWTGNRITCRDWFQLTLKEGLTVFRDQQFTADLNDKAVKRIDDVNTLRTAQFAEDGGPMAHPIQPSSYQEINNFYTATVYNKGAEVIRMIHTLLGEEKFRQGMDLYFEQYDGQAVTTEAFVAVMEQAGQCDLSQFRLWYQQAGTPEVTVAENYDEQTQVYRLNLSQETPATPMQASKQAFHIPVKISLMNATAQLMPLQLKSEQQSVGSSRVLNFTEKTQDFEFICVPEKPVLSLFQNFSAPIKLRFNRSNEELAFCMMHEVDDFNRWEAMQQLSSKLILKDTIKKALQENLKNAEQSFIDAFKQTLTSQTLEKALIARAISLPSISYLSELVVQIDVAHIFGARERIIQQLATHLEQDFLKTYHANSEQFYDLSPESMGKRFLRNQALSYLMYCGDTGEALALKQFEQAKNMTDQMSAFKLLVHHQTKSAPQVIEKFYQQWQKNNLVIDKWFSVQATVPHISANSMVEKLFQHADFDLKNPNRVRALLGAYCSANPVCFHHGNGFGYQLLGDKIKQLDVINPQIAARLCVPLTRFKRYMPQQKEQMILQLKQLLSLANLSADVFEMVEKSLK